MSISYRQLAVHEAERIREIAPSDFIERAWRKVGDAKEWLNINWTEDDFPDGYEHHLAALEKTFEGDGIAVGAFDGERLIGFCSIYRDIFGSQHKYILLDQIFIAPEYKRKGIGKRLFFMCVDQAKQRGADKFYIISGSSEATLAFYTSLGCENAKEINQELYEPEDEYGIILEYDFLNMPLPIKSERLYITKFFETMAESVHVNSIDEDNRRFVPDEVFETVSEAREIIDTITSWYSKKDAPQVYAVLLNDGLHIKATATLPKRARL
jgi:GNAT superfamily N-acetyltransferase